MKLKLTPEQQRRADTLARMTSCEWDAICKRCGICCLKKIGICNIDENTGMVYDSTTLYLKSCCDKFDTKTCRCSVYKTRLNEPNCEKVNMDIVLAGDLLPASCGYVEYIFGPAPFPARVDFKQVRPISDDDVAKMSDVELRQNMIFESVLWGRRQK